MLTPSRRVLETLSRCQTPEVLYLSTERKNRILWVDLFIQLDIPVPELLVYFILKVHHHEKLFSLVYRVQQSSSLNGHISHYFTIGSFLNTLSIGGSILFLLFLSLTFQLELHRTTSASKLLLLSYKKRFEDLLYIFWLK